MSQQNAKWNHASTSNTNTNTTNNTNTSNIDDDGKTSIHWIYIMFQIQIYCVFHMHLIYMNACVLMWNGNIYLGNKQH